jgi:hypothetical protein
LSSPRLSPSPPPIKKRPPARRSVSIPLPFLLLCVYATSRLRIEVQLNLLLLSPIAEQGPPKLRSVQLHQVTNVAAGTQRHHVRGVPLMLQHRCPSSHTLRPWSAPSSPGCAMGVACATARPRSRYEA